MKGWRAIAVVALVAGLTAAKPAQADWADDAGWGALTVLTNVVYMPAKVTYSVLGGLTGAFAFALTGGDLDTAETVWVTAMGGTYVITPRMLQGEDPIAFTGNRAESPSADTADNGSHELSEQPLGSR